MPLLSTSFEERNPVKIAVVTLIAVGAVTALLFNSVVLHNALTRSSYTARVSEAGGLAEGDPVRLNGAKVGQVDDVRLDGEQVVVEFSIDDVGRLGEDTRASVSAETVLGTKFLGLHPAGPGRMQPGSEIPLERTSSPYDVTDALSTLTRKSADIDKEGLTRALDTVSTTLKDTPVPLRSALDGVNRVSQTIATRDAALRELLAHAQRVTDLLAKRSGDIVTLVGEGRQLLAELNRRREVIQDLIVNVTETIDQLRGLVKDNSDQLGPALDELKDTLDLLNRNDKAIDAIVHGLGAYAGSLGDAVGGGPWFYAYIANLSSLPGPLGALNPAAFNTLGLPGQAAARLPTLPTLPLPAGGGR
jgi:phospholipid/cholesterol/gamma-HCH transport system substrate-binding protein